MVFDDETVQQVWDKGRAVHDREPEVWRKDACGAWIRREHYGREHSEYGWKIANISSGTPGEVDNLRPFHLQNDFDRNSGKARCRVAADREAIPATAQIDTPRNRNM